MATTPSQHCYSKMLSCTHQADLHLCGRECRLAPRRCTISRPIFLTTRHKTGAQAPTLMYRASPVMLQQARECLRHLILASVRRRQIVLGASVSTVFRVALMIDLKV